MKTIKHSAIVPYSVKEMYQLVSNVEHYPRFLTWCSSSQILKASEEEILAELTLNFKGVRHTFTTRNTLIKNESITLELVDGPFTHLEGIWRFNTLTEEQSEISLHLEFEFANSFTGLLLRPLFTKTADGLLQAFCEQAGNIK